MHASAPKGSALPDVIIAKVSFAGDVDDFLDGFVKGVLRYSSVEATDGPSITRATATITSGNASAGENVTTSTCAWGTVAMSTLGVETGLHVDDAALTYAEIRVVQNPSARTGAWTVEDYGAYVKDVHARWTGQNRGWDRWLDNHLGLEVSGDAGRLDRYVALLDARNISFRAKMGGVQSGSWNNTHGSLWTAGSGAQGVELHGTFDWSVLDANSTVGMDYCPRPRRPARRALRGRDAAPTATAAETAASATSTPPRTAKGSVRCRAGGRVALLTCRGGATA